MKKRMITTVMVLVLCVSGVSSNRHFSQKIPAGSYGTPMNKKLDSINLKAAELELLIRKL
ncbi:hypothetical protein AQ505_20435 [Pedobacter sp. PACM 27299]|nr:hypothetical protein AQ505_20435 [Pedobacter sp. PACM 27299]